MATLLARGEKDPCADSTSASSVLAAFVPAIVTAVTYLVIFAFIRNSNRKFYAPRTFLGTIPEKDRTPDSTADGKSWIYDYIRLPDSFVLQHNSLDAYLFLRFLKFIVGILLFASCITFPILLPANITGGGNECELDRLGFGNVSKKSHLWAHLVVAWVVFGGIILLIARERLRVIGIRQAYLLDDLRAARLSARTVLFLNAPPSACQSENLKEYFGNEAERSWSVLDAGELDDLVGKRNGAAYGLEKAQLDLIVAGVQRNKQQGRPVSGAYDGSEEGRVLVPKSSRPAKRKPPIIGTKFDAIEHSRKRIRELVERIEVVRLAPSRNVPGRSAVFVAFSSQAAAHRAFQELTLSPRVPIEDRFLGVEPKGVLWSNLAMPVASRVSKATFALAFVVAFTIFFAIPIGLIGSLSNVKRLAREFEWLSWLNDLPPVLIGLLSGFVPPYLISWFTSYVPKLFRHIAKMSGEPTTGQAELKTQAWYFVFLVANVFLVTVFSSGAAAVAADIADDPSKTPTLLAERLPSSSTFYLTYFILQGLGSAAQTIVNYSDLFEYYFYEYFWDKSPREKFQTFAQLKGTPWGSWFPKFTNFVVVAIAYACISPLVTGFATVGIFLYYLSYRHQMLYVVQTKIDTQGEAYKRALQQMPTGVYMAELSLIGLFGIRKAPAQATLMVVLLVITAVGNLVLDRMLRPLELYLGVDVWQEQEPLLAQEDGVPQDDEAALHASSHARRLGLRRLPDPMPRILSDFFDSIISGSREQAESWLYNASTRDEDTSPLKEDDLKKAYLAPAFTSKLPRLWIPKDDVGVSKQEIELNQAAGIPTTDDGAEIDDDGKLHWDHRFENVPIFSKPKTI